tara:strand:- start:35271 stop:35633 length:363 start_codon:yes stop_codon:yes gene_type:complete
MSRLEIILSAILTLSMIINIGIFVYARYAIVQLLSVSEELGDLQQMVNSFTEHLSSIYELEMFYGDETISSLREHALSFNEQLATFEYIYSLTEKGETPIYDEADEEDYDDTDEEDIEEA